MASPEVSEIKLVGAVLDLDQTPLLNQESSDGKVQFFQVSFRDGKHKKTSYINWIKWLKILLIAVGSTITAILIYLAITQTPKLSNRDSKRNEYCNSNKRNKAYVEEIQSIRESLIMDMSRLPEWSTFREARVQCASGRLNIVQQEQKLIKCYFSVRNRVNDLPVTARPDLGKIESCVQFLCSRRLSHLSSICRRL
jgi:large-conductance mechanosensitive channel